MKQISDVSDGLGAVDMTVEILVNMGKVLALLLEGCVVATHDGAKKTLDTTVV
jgi:hypothetical protein